MSYIPVNIEEAIKKECYRRRLSPRTAETYLSCIERFMKWTKKDIRYISKKDVRLFLEYLSEKNSAGSTMNVYHMALRFLFENVLEKRMWIDIKYSKTPKRLPEFLTKEETKKLIDSIINFKHQLMICLMYSAGLRVSELLNLKVKDLELDKEKFAKTNFSQKLQTSHKENFENFSGKEENKNYSKFSKQKLESKKYPIEDLCFSLQETVFAMLVETAERALAHTGKKELLLGGGVACNSRLQEMCKIMCAERGAKFFCPERQFLVDNAGMIAFLGEIEFNSGIKVSGKEIEKLDIKPRERTDNVEVKWK